MSTKIFSDQKALNILKRLNENTEDEYYKITAEEYKELMKLASYNGEGLSKIKTFKKKPLYIIGDVKLSNTPTKSIGNVAYIEGSLDISRTNVSSIGNTIVKGHIWDHNSPREKIRIQKELQSKKDELNSLKEDNERSLDNPNIDEEGLMANAIMEFLQQEQRHGAKGIDILTNEDEEKIKELNLRKSELTQKLESLKKQNEEDYDDQVQEQIDSIEEDIGFIDDELYELEEEKVGLYDLYQTRYKHYGLTVFHIVNYEHKDVEIVVGDSDEMDEAALEYAKSYIDEVGLDGFNRGFIDDYIDEDQVKQLASEFYEDDIRDNPESYFDDDDFKLTSEQEKRIEELEMYIEKMEELKDETKDKMDEFEHNSDEYNNLEEKFQEIETNIETAQEELDSIEIDKEPTEDMIEEKLNSIIRDDVLYDPVNWLKDRGYEVKYYIDEDKLAQGLADSEGWGIMNGYDGNYYGPYDINGNDYYIMRMN